MNFRSLLAGATMWLTFAVICAAQNSYVPLTNAQYDEIHSLVDQVVIGGSVCDVGLLPASKRRKETIVAVIDFSGRLFCNTLVRVSWVQPPLLLQEISGWWIGSLTPAAVQIIQDIDGDNEPDLVVPTAISDYEGTRACTATLPFVYSCSAERCSDVSDQSPEFYRTWQDSLISELLKSEASSSGAQRDNIPCLVMAIDKSQRLVGMNPKAGLSTAKQWARSTDLFLQRKAVWILSVIYVATGDSSVLKELKILAENGHDYHKILFWLEQRKRLFTRW